MVIGDQASQDNNAQPKSGTSVSPAHLTDLRLTSVSSHCCSCFRSVIWKMAAISVPTATRNIFNQNEKVTSSRTGSPITIRIPVASMQTQRAGQPGTEPARGLPQCLIHPRPSQDAEIDHEYGSQYHSNADNVNGLNRWDNPTVMVLYEDAQECCGQPLGKLLQVSFFLGANF